MLGIQPHTCYNKSMGIFISGVILVLVALILASMQLTPGTFILFYHYTLGKNSAKKASALSLYFILGYATFLVITWLLVHSLIFAVFYFLQITNSQFFNWTLAGILFVESILSLFFYYKKGKFTALFIPRSIAKTLEIHAQNSKTRTDAFTLGFLSSIPELLFTLPLFALSSITLMQISYPLRATTLILSLLVIVFPLFYFIYLFFSNHNLAEIERLRIRLKPTFRLIICFGFLALTFAIINLGVNYYG